MKKPRFADKAVRVAEIQNAARKVFFEKGFKNATVEHIAKRARLSKGTVYLYFKSKEDLYISMMLPVLEKFGLQLMEIEKSYESGVYESGKVLMQAFCDKLWELYLFDPEGNRIIQVFQQGDHFSEMSEETHDKISAQARENFITMRKILAKASQDGLLNTVDPIKLSDAMWGLYVGVVQLEESKLRSTNKDHIYDTLQYSFSLFCHPICN